MKKVLIITSKGSDFVSWQDRANYVRTFSSGAEKHLSNTKLFLTTYSDISCFISSNKLIFF
jgi:hypothetical protein